MANDQSSRYEYRTLRPSREATKKETADPIDELNDLGATDGCSSQPSSTPVAARNFSCSDGPTPENLPSDE